MIKARIMLSEGEKKFREYINRLKQNQPESYPNLNVMPYSQEFFPSFFVDETKMFRTKLDLAEYLHNCFLECNIAHEKVVKETGLWTWLAYIWFDQLTNRKKHILKREEHYICPSPSNYRRYYIHLVAPPYILYTLHRLPISLIFLYNPPWEINDFTERVAANQFLVSHPNIIEAIYHLYFDISRSRPKPNATSSDFPGSVRRFIKVFQQLEFTYDIYSMDWKRIIELLPDEFNYWKSFESAQSY